MKPATMWLDLLKLRELKAWGDILRPCAPEAPLGHGERF